MSKIVINGVDGNFGSLVAKYALKLMNKEDLVFTAPKEESLKEYKDQGIKTAIANFNDPEGLVKVFENKGSKLYASSRQCLIKKPIKVILEETSYD